MTRNLRHWCAVALLVLAAACAPPAPVSGTPAAPPVGEARSPREARIVEPRAAVGVFPRTVHDSSGDVVIPSKPVRIHTLSVGLDEITFELVDPSRIAAIGTVTANPAYSNIADRPDGHALDDRRTAVTAGVADGFLFLTHSDTDLSVIDQAVAHLPDDFPRVRAHGVGHLKNDSDVDALLDEVLPGAEVIVVRLMGGRASFGHGLDRILEHVRRTDKWLLCLPGTDALDPELTALSTTGVPVAHEAFAYLQFGGVDNYANLLRFLADHLLAGGFGFDRPAEQPRHGLYRAPDATAAAHPGIGVLFYRSHLLSGNTRFVDALIDEIEAQGASARAVYAYSLKEPEVLEYFAGGVDVIIATTSFAMGQVNADGPTQAGWSVEALDRLGVPVLQAVTVGSGYAQWEASPRGLTPIETAMNVALPEFDGRIITVPISFKEPVRGGVEYVPRQDRIRRVVTLAMRLARLQRLPNSEKKIALILTNYNAKASRIGNAVGLDTPASVLRLLHALHAAGYDVGDPSRLPVDGDALLAELIDRGSVNPKWIARIQEHSYKGALELAATVDYLFGYDATSDVLEDWMYEEVTRTYVLDSKVQEFLARSNPWALKDMSARLIEAVQRGLWTNPAPELRDALEQAYLDADALLEAGARV